MSGVDCVLAVHPDVLDDRGAEDSLSASSLSMYSEKSGQPGLPRQVFLC